jgi:zinc protease
VTASHFAPTELGMFTIGVELQAERIPETLDHIAQAVLRLRERGSGLEDLERARRLLKMRWARGLEPMEGRAAALGGAEALRDVPLLDEQYDQLARVTPDEVRDAVARYLVPARLAVLAHLPRETKSGLARDELERVFGGKTVTPLSNPSPTALEAPAPVVVQAEMRHAVHHAALPGVDVLVHRKAGVPVATLGLYAPRGRFDPPEQAGLGALALRSAVRGAGGMNASGLAFAFEQLGGALVPRIASDWLGFDTSVLVDHLVPAAVLLREVMASPAFAPAAVEEERTVLLAEARQVADDMFRYPFQLAFRGAFADLGYGLPTFGLPSTIEALEGADVPSWHADWLAGTRLTIVAVGDFDPDQALERLAGAFRAWPRASKSPDGPEETWAVNGGVVERQAKRDKAQSALAFLFPGPTRRDPRRYAAEVWAAVASGLGGRLFETLRERRSLAYTVLATHWQRPGAGALATYIATSPEREQEAREAMLEELEVFRREAVGKRELRQSVNYLVGQAEVRRQIGAQVLAEIRDAWLLGEGLEELEDPGAHYRSVSAGQVQDLANACLDPDRLAIGVVRGVGSG